MAIVMAKIPFKGSRREGVRRTAQIRNSQKEKQKIHFAGTICRKCFICSSLHIEISFHIPIHPRPPLRNMSYSRNRKEKMLLCYVSGCRSKGTQKNLLVLCQSYYSFLIQIEWHPEMITSWCEGTFFMPWWLEEHSSERVMAEGEMGGLLMGRPESEYKKAEKKQHRGWSTFAWRMRAEFGSIVVVHGERSRSKKKKRGKFGKSIKQVECSVRLIFPSRG